MGGITLYDRRKQDFSGENNNYKLFGNSLLSNPYTDIGKNGTLSKVKDLNESLSRYRSYFKMMSNGNVQFKNLIHEIYLKYKSGENIYFECPGDIENSHGNIIKSEIERQLLKEKIQEIKNAQ